MKIGDIKYSNGWGYKITQVEGAGAYIERLDEAAENITRVGITIWKQHFTDHPHSTPKKIETPNLSKEGWTLD